MTAQEAISVAEKHKSRFPKLYNDVSIVYANPQFQLEFDVVGLKAWIITGEFLMFGKIEQIWFVISDKTAKVEYVFDKRGNKWGSGKLK